MNKTHYNEEMSMTSIYNVLNTCQENTEAYERSTEDAHHLTQNLERNENTESNNLCISSVEVYFYAIRLTSY